MLASLLRRTVHKANDLGKAGSQASIDKHAACIPEGQASVFPRQSSCVSPQDGRRE